MNTYVVALTRTYVVSIKAENEERAKRFSEYYLGNCPDLSNEKERKDKKFSIEEIELAYNEASEIVSVED